MPMTTKALLDALEEIETFDGRESSSKRFADELPRWRLHREVHDLPENLRGRILTAGSIILAGAMLLPVKTVGPALERATRLINQQAEGRGT